MPFVPPPGLSIRRVQPETDDVSALTALLHRGYAELAERGLRFVASYQDDEVTRDYATRGETYVAVLGGAIVGTVTVFPPGQNPGTPWYERADVAVIGKFCVEPPFRRRGVGRTLLEYAERRAIHLGVAEVAVDTAEPALDLIALYTRRGYRLVGHTQWHITNYRSVVLSKPVGPPTAG